jgi:hypothetical protein
MRQNRWWAGGVVALVLSACGTSEQQDTPVQLDNPVPSAIVEFEGTVDLVQQTIGIRYPSPTSGQIGVDQADVVIPYGTGAGQAFFHTCPGTVAFNAGTHLLTGSVQAVNNTAATVQMLNAVIDSVSPAGVTPASGIIASYGTVNSGVGANCSSNTATWTFTDPTNTNFTFIGHADGAAASIPVTTISDFSSVNPLAFAYGSSWTTPSNQFQAFTAGTVSGQQVVPIGAGNPTVSGGAGRSGLALNLTGATGLQLTARLVAGSQATVIQVFLSDVDGTVIRFDYPTTSFNAATFSSVVVAVGATTTVTAGTTAGLDLAHVNLYEVQGNFFDSSGAAKFDVQFDALTAVQ